MTQILSCNYTVLPDIGKQVPLRRGTDFHIVMGPRLAYCPKESSMNTRGMPQNISMVMYGMKKAPATKTYTCQEDLQQTITIQANYVSKSRSDIKKIFCMKKVHS